MGMNCNICASNFNHGPDAVVLCRHKQGFVHLGCCIHNCSGHMQPCGNSVGTYDKLS